MNKFNQLKFGLVNNKNCKYAEFANLSTISQYNIENFADTKERLTVDNTNWEHQGCFNDKPERALPTQLNNVTSVQDCLKQAKDKGFNTFALQYGGQCFAGNNTDWNKYGPAGACDRLGGTWTQQVYTTIGPSQQVVAPPQQVVAPTPKTSSIVANLPPAQVSLYKNDQVYNLGDIVMKDGQNYVMVDVIGQAGHAPPKPTNWRPIDNLESYCHYKMKQTQEQQQLQKQALARVEAEQKAQLLSIKSNPDIMLYDRKANKYVIKSNVIPLYVVLGKEIRVGKSQMPINISKIIRQYDKKTNYVLGDVVSLKGRNYINLSYPDPRGTPYSSSINKLPERDRLVWKKVMITN